MPTTNNGSEIIRVENIKKSFGLLEVLKDISFSVNQGEVLGIIGPSGSGKSTLLRCINVLERPEKGTIQLENHTIDFVASGWWQGDFYGQASIIKEKNSDFRRDCMRSADILQSGV